MNLNKLNHVVQRQLRKVFLKAKVTPLNIKHHNLTNVTTYQMSTKYQNIWRILVGKEVFALENTTSSSQMKILHWFRCYVVQLQNWLAKVWISQNLAVTTYLQRGVEVNRSYLLLQLILLQIVVLEVIQLIRKCRKRKFCTWSTQQIYCHVLNYNFWKLHNIINYQILKQHFISIL